MSRFDDDVARGCLENGEPLDALYGVGWWTEMPEEEPEPEPEPELKPCPFCGAMPTKLNSGYTCSTLGCALQENTVSAKAWNNRPIEDALTARIAELEGFIDRLIEAGDDKGWGWDKKQTNLQILVEGLKEAHE